MNISDHIVARLRAWGVHRVYGYPGDGIGGVLVAVSERDDMQFVQVRHEETAGFAATADVKFGGSPIGCCIVTSGREPCTPSTGSRPTDPTSPASRWSASQGRTL